MEFDRCSNIVIGAAIEVHRELGVGLLESAYETALAVELQIRGLAFERQVLLPATYKGVDLGDAYRMDFVVERQVVVEIKAVRILLPVHRYQLVTYLRLSRKQVGLVINFHANSLRHGLCRIVNSRPGQTPPS